MIRLLLFTLGGILFSLSFNNSFAQTSVSAPNCIPPFYHGVASGDPLSDRVIIWTRITPSNFTLPAVVSYKVATDTSMVNIVSQGSVMTDASKDYTVKVDVLGLSPDSYYYYEFQSNGSRSQRGRTKTAPVGSIDSLRFAVVSCANLESGYFNAYRVINERNDVDAVLMLGDYIYEYESGGYAPNTNIDRIFDPTNEILTLDDYRMRYSIYHMDEALRKLHQNFPWICVWDDHESANDSFKDGAENHNAGEGDWQLRKQAAQKAYFEWLPIREKAPDNYEIFRSFKYGDLVDLIMIDTRIHGRDEQVGATSGLLNSSTRTMLGVDQTDWLKDELSNSTAQWKVLGNQVMMAPITVFGVPINTDSWDGYPVTRQDLYDHILLNQIDNFVVITGDIHTSWALDLKSGSNKVGVEFVAPSITSPGSPIDGGGLLSLENPHLKYSELTKKGFIILDVNTERIQADWFYVNSIDAISNSYNWAKSYYSSTGGNQLINTNTASEPASKYDVIQAPDCPRDITADIAEMNNTPKIIAVYPNPAEDKLMFHFYSDNMEGLIIKISDFSGRILKTEKLGNGYPSYELNISDLAPASYLLIIEDSNGNKTTATFMKK